MHRKCKDVFPNAFEGARMLFNRGLSSHFQVSHTVNINSQNSGYRFNTTYVGNKETGPGEAFPVLLGDTDASGNVNAMVMHQFGDHWRVKLNSSIEQGKMAGTQGSVDYRGRLSTMGIALANPDIINDSGVFVGTFLRRLTDNLDIGAQLVNQYGNSIPGDKMTMLEYAARWSAKDWILSGTYSHSLGAPMMEACYYHKQTENLAFGVNFEANWRLKEATTSLGYTAELPEVGVTFRGMCDSNLSSPESSRSAYPGNYRSRSR
ncbi:hypothetical protein L596_010864 [Steinernema carpocapsae]|uniref:Uncharacterized protein n=1 Tax=Steinernema carpocapsae TaxID=34508 RepID=A0A4V6A714_STECR|nr:hypothetical protein L596_010864 [Steinernema carpocapsae]